MLSRLARPHLWRGLTTVTATLLTIALVAGQVLEMYRSSVDAFFGTISQKTVTDESASSEDPWTFKSEFTTAEAAYEGLREFAITESEETVVLLKNSEDALPISPQAKITLLGVRSYAPVYGSSGGSITDGKSVVSITDAFADSGFELNPELTAAYESHFAGKQWVKPRFGGGINPEYEELASLNDPGELSLE